jgi:hypothetical protein
MDGFRGQNLGILPRPQQETRRKKNEKGIMKSNQVNAQTHLCSHARTRKLLFYSFATQFPSLTRLTFPWLYLLPQRFLFYLIQFFFFTKKRADVEKYELCRSTDIAGLETKQLNFKATKAPRYEVHIWMLNILHAWLHCRLQIAQIIFELLQLITAVSSGA